MMIGEVGFNENAFKRDVDQALKSVERILNVQRNPRLAEEIDHEYQNKFDLANIMGNTWIIALMNCLERMGLSAEILQTIDKSQSTTLRFQSSNACQFLREITLQVPLDKTVVETVETTATNSPSFEGTTTKSTISRVVNNIKEYHWKVDVQWELSIYSGTDVVNSKKILQTRSSQMIVVIQSNQKPPLPATQQNHEPHDVSLTWLMKQINNGTLTAQFKIDTQHDETKTPSRNPQVVESLDFLKNFSQWTECVRKHFKFLQQSIVDKHNPAGPLSPKSSKQNARLGQVVGSSKRIFNPIQPLMEEPSVKEEVVNEMTVDNKSILSLGAEDGAEGDKQKISPLLSANDMGQFLNEQIRSLEEKMESLRNIFPDTGGTFKIISVAEAVVYLLCEYCNELNLKYVKSVQYNEKMLENQLIAAIGKRVNSADLDKFVKFHNAKLLNPTPIPFCRAIRRNDDHYPEGILSIEDKADQNTPIETFVREVKIQTSLKIPLNAANTLKLTGQTFLHGWLRHRFQPTQNSRTAYQLSARARQFSSFILVVGTMVGPDRLKPQGAIILQNKDEVIIPLLLEEIPTAKEFKDAIKSLSPEQQHFCQSFRSMQLESSVLGVCVIQIKPQLETLLGLPSDSLTKEMKLTQYLMKLFVEYNVPSDLLSYDGVNTGASTKEKIDNVKSHVQAVADVIDAGKIDDWEAGAMRATAAVHQAAAQAFYGQGAGLCTPSIFAAPVPAPSTGLFGQPSAAPSAFGAAPMHSAFGGFTTSPAPAPLGGFGGSAPNPGSSLFGSSPAAAFGAPAPSTFGIPASAPAPGAFGGSPAPVSAKPPAETPTTTHQSAFAFGAQNSPPPVPADTVLAVEQQQPQQQQQQTQRAPEEGERTKEKRSAREESKPAESSNITKLEHRSEPLLVEDDQSDHQQQNIGDVSELLASTTSPDDGVINFTMLPKVLDAVVERHSADGALRSTVIKTGSVWDRHRQQNLLLPGSFSKLNAGEIKSEKDKAFDLLDALSRCGTLPISCSELHVIVCLTHCFEKDVVGTVIQDNINPIEKLELSTLLLASAIHGVTPKDLIRNPEEVNRLSSSFPKILN